MKDETTAIGHFIVIGCYLGGFLCLLKLFGVVSWPWWLVSLPLWPLGILMAVTVLLFVCTLFVKN